LLAIDPEPSSLWPRREPIERVQGISRREFEERFLTSHGGEGRPAIVVDAMDRWPCKQRWSLDFFAERFGHLTVRCWCRSSRHKPYNAIGYELPLADYIAYCRAGDLTQPPPGARSVGAAAELRPEAGTLYWYENFARPEFASLLDDFDLDVYFLDNLQAHLRGDWKRLILFLPFTNLFIGGAGTCVDLHKDYWSSHTLIAHLAGRKHAILFPPSDGAYLHNANREPLDPRRLDAAAYPDFARATLFQGYLEPGETLFMPPNWYHDVLGLTPTLSLGLNIYTVHNFGEYLPNLLSYPLQLHRILEQHPTLRREVHDAAGQLLEGA
jgi:histone arginine demethylase JMJD6